MKSRKRIQFLGLPPEVVAELDPQEHDIEFVAAAVVARWRGGGLQGGRRRSGR